MSQRKIDGAAHRGVVTFGRMGGKGGEQYGSHGGGDEAEREINHAFAVEECGGSPFADPHGEKAIDEHIELCDSHPQGGGPHEDEHFADAGVVPVAGKAKGATEAFECRELYGHLEDAGQKYGPCKASGARVVVANDGEEDEHGADEHNIEEARGECGGGKVAV